MIINISLTLLEVPNIFILNKKEGVIFEDEMLRLLLFWKDLGVANNFESLFVWIMDLMRDPCVLLSNP